MPKYKIKHGKVRPVRKGKHPGGPIAREGDIIEMSVGQAAVYSDMLERMPSPAELAEQTKEAKRAADKAAEEAEEAEEAAKAPAGKEPTKKAGEG